MTFGICTLGNDAVLDQVIALLNSIEAQLGTEMPVCIYPYDENVSALKAAIAPRPQVTLYDDRESLETWQNYAKAVWATHPTAQQEWLASSGNPYHRIGTHHRMCAFDGPFDEFIYMDADTLLMGDITPIRERLQSYDWVVYDFQYKDPSHVFNVKSPRLYEVFPQTQVERDIFCSGWFAAKRHTFDIDRREWLLTQLRHGEGEILYPMSVDQSVLNYMVLRSGLKSCNLAFDLPAAARTGCCVTSKHFTEADNVLYDKGNRLTYLHYIGVSSKCFKGICAGDNIEVPYRDIFLHYRYLNTPEQRPQLRGKPKSLKPQPTLQQRVSRKLTGLMRG